MSNVDSIYTIVGDGRVARHLAHYLSLLGISFSKWARRSDSEADLARKVDSSSHVVVLIGDSAIEEFVAQNLSDAKKTVVHFSGSLVSPAAYGAHPLMTFTEQLYPLDLYLKIPFILDDPSLAFEDMLPGLPNRHFRIEPELKPLYHALCVSSGNFTTILWDRFFEGIVDKLGLPSDVAFPYLDQISENLKNREVSALTGPLARGDLTTIKNNLRALEGDPLQKVYHGFLKALNLKIRETS